MHTFSLDSQPSGTILVRKFSGVPCFPIVFAAEKEVQILRVLPSSVGIMRHKTQLGLRTVVLESTHIPVRVKPVLRIDRCRRWPQPYYGDQFVGYEHGRGMPDPFDAIGGLELNVRGSSTVLLCGRVFTGSLQNCKCSGAVRGKQQCEPKFMRCQRHHQAYDIYPRHVDTMRLSLLGFYHTWYRERGTACADHHHLESKPLHLGNTRSTYPRLFIFGW